MSENTGAPCESCDWHGPHMDTLGDDLHRVGLEMHRSAHRAGIDLPVSDPERVRAELAELTLSPFVEHVVSSWDDDEADGSV